jgi:drug/metabolite transporter (DMT)-like permease
VGAIRRGLVFGFLASLTWGTAFVAGKYGSHEADPIFLAFGRYLVAAVLLVGLALVVRGREMREAVRESPLGLVFLGLTGIFGMGALSFAALRYTTSINTSILMNANPIFTVLLATVVGERLSAEKLVGVIAGLVGCVLVVSGGTTEAFRFSASDILGCLLSVGSAVCWALYTVYGKGIVREHGGLVATTGAMVVGVLLFIVYMCAARTPVTLAPKTLLTILYLGVVPTAIGFLLWYVALATEDASHLAPLQFTAPLCTAVLGWVFLGERMTLISIAGMLLIFVGIYVASIRANAQRKVISDQ